MMRGHYWKWERDTGIVSECSLDEWGAWVQKDPGRRILERTTVGHHDVSTVFLGIDHNFGVHGAPILWETMVFDKGTCRESDRFGDLGGRYETQEQAQAGHDAAVLHLRGALS